MQKRNITTERIDVVMERYFDGEATPSQARRIQAWMVDGEHAQEKERALEQIWERYVGESEPDEKSYAALEDIRRRLGFDAIPVRARRFGRPAKIAAAACLLLSVGTAAWFALHEEGGSPAGETVLASAQPLETPPTISLSGPGAGHAHATLPDGSRVWVNRGGSVAWAEDFAENRMVYLEGEAYFSVVKQDGNPFVVVGDGISVRVLGTEFLMRAGSRETSSRVDVATGTVEVTAHNATHRLGDHDRLVADKELGRLMLSHLSPEERIAAWKDLDLDFDDTTLGEALNTLATWYGVELLIDERLRLGERLTVRFAEDEPMDEVLKVMQNTLRSFDYDTADGRVTVTRRR